ncbi:uncharacterized protein LOC144342573 [Saccoglossus kowalevskii]
MATQGPAIGCQQGYQDATQKRHHTRTQVMSGTQATQPSCIDGFYKCRYEESQSVSKIPPCMLQALFETRKRHQKCAMRCLATKNIQPIMEGSLNQNVVCAPGPSIGCQPRGTSRKRPHTSEDSD